MMEQTNPTFNSSIPPVENQNVSWWKRMPYWIKGIIIGALSGPLILGLSLAGIGIYAFVPDLPILSFIQDNLWGWGLVDFLAPTWLGFLVIIIIHSFLGFSIGFIIDVKRSRHKKRISIPIIIILVLLMLTPLYVSKASLTCNFLIDGKANKVKSYCYANQATIKKDVNICIDKVVDPHVKNGCFYDLALIKDNLQFCDKIAKSDASYHDLCFTRIALQRLDTAICDRVQNSHDRDNCVKDIAEKTQDDSICKKINSPGLMDYCNFDVSRNLYKTDSERLRICEKIKDEKLLDKCIKDILQDSFNF